MGIWGKVREVQEGSRRRDDDGQGQGRRRAATYATRLECHADFHIRQPHPRRLVGESRARSQPPRLPPPRVLGRSGKLKLINIYVEAVAVWP